MTNRVDKLSLLQIERYLDSAFFDVKIVDEIDSTNTYLKDLAMQGASEGSVIIARNQTCGRGRQGRVFHSPKDSGIYMSIFIKPTTDNLAILTAIAGVVTCESIREVCGNDAKIKWVNDVLIGDKKCAGILCETVIKDGKIDGVIVGIGINVYKPQDDFEDDIKDIATYLSNEVQLGLRDRLIATILNKIYEYVKMQNRQEVIKKYKTLNCTVGKDIVVNKNENLKNAYATDIDDECRLIVKYEDGSEEILSFGEVRVSV